MDVRPINILSLKHQIMSFQKLKLSKGRKDNFRPLLPKAQQKVKEINLENSNGPFSAEKKLNFVNMMSVEQKLTSRGEPKKENRPKEGPQTERGFNAQQNHENQEQSKYPENQPQPLPLAIDTTLQKKHDLKYALENPIKVKPALSTNFGAYQIENVIEKAVIEQQGRGYQNLNNEPSSQEAEQSYQTVQSFENSQGKQGLQVEVSALSALSSKSNEDLIGTDLTPIAQQATTPEELTNEAEEPIQKSSCRDAPQLVELDSQISMNQPVEQIVLEHNRNLNEEVERVRRERDQLQFANKKLEVQLMQSNCEEYYKKEHTRLKTEVESLQEINEEIKHNNFVLQNSNKELTATEQLQRQEIKKLLKNLQASKIEATEAKHQLKQKERSFSVLLKKVEERNNELSSSYDMSTKKAVELEGVIRLKSLELERAGNTNISLEKKIAGLQQNRIDHRKLYDEELRKKTSMVDAAEENLRNYRRESESVIRELSQNLSNLETLRQSESLRLQEKSQGLSKVIDQTHKDLQIIRLEEELKSQIEQNEQKSCIIKNLSAKINDQMVLLSTYQQFKEQLRTQNQRHIETSEGYENQISTLLNRINLLEKELKNFQLNSTKNEDPQFDGSQNHLSFKEALKAQIKESEQLKEEIYQIKEETSKVRVQLQEAHQKNEELQNDRQILKKQYKILENNSKSRSDALGQQLNCEIESVKRKLATVEKKLESKIKENKEKECFITDVILGRSGKEEGAYLIKELQRIFLGAELAKSIA